MSECDGCGALKLPVELAYLETATIDENGDPQPGELCEDCWPDGWAWPFDRAEEVADGD